MKIFISKAKYLFSYLPFITFLYGMLIGLLITFKQHERYVHSIFVSIEDNISKKVPYGNEDSLIITSLNITHDLLNNRDTFFKHEASSQLLQNDFYNSISEDIISVSNACGSYTMVLARLLNDMGFKTRIAQMEVNKTYAGHIILEVLTKKGWIVLDPLYKLYFKDPSGNMASFKEVSADWEFYKRSTPANYNTAYNYKGVRYTNWNKIPIVMPLLKKSLNLIIGKSKADEISLRSYFLSSGKFYCTFFSVLLVLLSAYIIFLLKRKGIFKNIGGTQNKIAAKTAYQFS